MSTLRKGESAESYLYSIAESLACNYVRRHLTPTVDLDAHTSGDVMFTAVKIRDALNFEGQSALLDNIIVFIDDAVTATDIDLVFFKSSVDVGDVNDAYNLTTSDIDQLLGTVKFLSTEFSDTGDFLTAEKKNVGLIVEAPEEDTSIYVVGVARGAIDFATVNDLRINVSIQRN